MRLKHLIQEAAARCRSVRGGAALAVALTFGAGPLSAHEINLKDLQIKHPHTVEPASAAIKDVDVSMTIRNHGKTADRLIGVSSPLAESATILNPTGASAAGATGIDLPAGETIKLSPKEAHIALHGLKDPLTGYEMFPLNLTFEKSGTIEIEVMVEENNDGLSGNDH